jgi:hypothetical protein
VRIPESEDKGAWKRAQVGMRKSAHVGMLKFENVSA